MSAFSGLPDQPHARRLLEAALATPTHAYLLAGPSGTAKRLYAERFAAALLGSELRRVEGRTHPDLFVLEPEGGSILIDAARRLRRDLYLRPFEAARRVYLVLDAHLLRDESANALLKSLEEPPDYGVFVLVSDHAERMLETIRSRVATIPFRRFSRAALEAEVSDPVAARVALGDLARAREVAGDGAAAERRRRYLALARETGSGATTASAAAAEVIEACARRAAQARRRIDAERKRRLESVDDERERRTLERRYDERARREGRRAEWDELRLAVDTVALWYRDVLAATLGAEDTVVDSDLAGEIAEDAATLRTADALEALEAVSDVRRSLELNIHPELAMEALFSRLRRAPSH